MTAAAKGRKSRGGAKKTVRRRPGGFRVVPHTSEMALSIRARRFPGFYRNAALGLLALYGAEGRPAKLQTRRLTLKQDSAEELLVAWLNELNYLIAAKRWLPVRVKLTRAYATELTAEVVGGPLDGIKLAREVKAATFGGLRLSQEPDGYHATVILDV